MTGATVTRNVEAELLPFGSEAVIVMNALPERPGSGVRSTVRLVLLPVTATPELAMRAGFEETAETVRLPAVVSGSLTVKGTGAATASSRMTLILSRGSRSGAGRVYRARLGS